MTITAAATAALPQATGPFAQESTLPFKTTDFSKIQDTDYKPGFEQGMAIQQAEIAAIVANPEAPTFANTIVALDQSGQMLNRVYAAFNTVIGANTNDTLDATEAEMSPKLTAHFDAIQLDPALFARVKAVYDNRAAMTLTPEDAWLLEKTYEDMVHAGAQLTEAQKTQVKAINAKLSEQTTAYSQRLTEATNASALVVPDKAALAGLSEAEVTAAAKAAEARGLAGQYLIPLQNTTQQPQLSTLSDRATREALFEKSVHRADLGDANDTRMLLAEIMQLRAQKAALFGNSSWAEYTMYDRMAKEPKTALDFMRQMVPALAASQRAEAGVLNAAIAADGKDFQVQPWDWQMYADKVKKERYAFDEETVKPYFEIRHVLEDGVFYAAGKLYGLTFEPRTDLPVWHPDVWTYTVYDRDGSELGLFYFDPYQRDSKRGGAWMSTLVDYSKLRGTKTVAFNVLNIPKAAEGQPQLVSWDNVNTMFHEFGHALHYLLSDLTYASGGNVARDFVEYPSQVNEMWASDPQVLANYAKHYQTGAPIPLELIDKINAAAKWNQGYEFGEVVEAALLDMEWHALTPAQAAAIDTPAKVDEFEAAALERLGLEVGLVPPRYRSSYFRHIFSDPAGYSAGYYSYLWTEMLDRDSRAWFTANGGLTRANGDHYRETVLSKGGTQDYFKAFHDFAGREPQVGPLLEARGLTGK
ncbi:M3 family metallopeptidase [Croceibacterium sp. LX-88]|uniref:M3 family metallopeptidase n=1 Tax=Croceibacterium selenioxidans TaxID=2838833 RepID=A0ABS5W2L4_9SPHN|nr:M3 family metallopeptidase [Croceibacterium selenioxidans]MBT2133362.1 M3 family metallopeptidase [Croceibacterium selenioxidans]